MLPPTEQHEPAGHTSHFSANAMFYGNHDRSPLYRGLPDGPQIPPSEQTPEQPKQSQ